MDTTYSKNRNFNRMFVNILSIVVILALVFPLTGTVVAQDETPPALTPFIWADPFCECVNGWDWQVGDSITIEVFDPDNNQFELQQPTQVYSQDNGVFFELGPEGINLQPGYRITMSDDQITKVLVVSALAVKEMNPVANVISGVFDPNLPLSIHVGDQQPLNLETNNDLWVATFESLDGFGEVSQSDEDGDQTGMGWDGVPNFMRYDIYAFDAQTGNIQRITRLDGTGEYNPTWSPNGKKIAHDVVYWDGSHGIYITDVKTGVSAPLVGADDGGNDAVWSPNGRWIAFDRRWVGDPTLYLVPSGGGDALLIRNDAVSADWAPNGKRVVFQQPSDGSIRTAPVDGGSSGETVINPNGENPSWSPDGNWIAYQNGGDIWKVQVNVQGTTFGEPIQMTSGPVWDNGPTWSADSQNIIFDSGMTEDRDLWMVPAAGGMATWLNGAFEFGDYDPAAAKNSTNIAYESPSPDGQAARLWIANFSYDVGTWTEGEHNYYFETTYSVPEPWSGTSNPITFNVTPDAHTYNGYVLLRTFALRARVGSGCPAITPLLNPEQNTRFSYGWQTDFPMTYAEAIDHFNSMVVKAHWDDGMSADLQRHEIFSLSSVDFGEIVCSSTEAPPELYPRIVASEAGDWFWMTEFNVGTLDLFLYESAEDGATLLWSGQTDVTDTWGITSVGYDIHGQDMLPGNYLVVSDGVNSKGLVLETITVDVFDTENEIMAGTAPLGRDVVAAAGPQEWQERITVTADFETGAWLADFKTIGFDITEDMRGWSSAAIYDGDGDANEGGTPPPPPNPRFVVFPEWEWFDGNDWPDGATVTITVDGKPECATSKESWGNFFNGSFGEGCDVVVGDTVTFTDGATVRTHTVRNLAVVAVDAVTNIVVGTANPYETVYVWQHEPGEQIPVEANENGEWSADLSGFYDIHPGSSGRSEIRDEFGNATAVDWYVPNPHFSVFPEQEYIEGWEWPDGATIYASIEEKSDCSAEGIAAYNEWDPITFVQMWFPEGCDAVVGDVVTMTDNETTRQHTIQNLVVTGVDAATDTVSGTADPGVSIHVWPHGYNELLPTADANGNWMADFTEIGTDLVEGMSGRTEIRDEFGNATAVDWRILNPYIEAAPYSDWIHAREWPLGTLMTLEIDDPSDGLGDVDYSETAFMQQAPWNPNDPNDIVADFRWPDQFTPGSSYVLTMSGNGQSKTLVISQLNMTGVNLEADIISGTGTPNAQIQVCANIPNRCITRWLIADGDGGWTANYGVPGTGNDDPDTFDVQPGSNGWAADYEQDSDRTWFDWRVPNPYIEAAPYSDWIHAREWPIGTLMTLEIDDPSDGIGDDDQDGNPADYSETATMQQAPWNPGDPNDIVADFRWPDQFAPGPGYILTMSGNGQTKTLIISNLNVTGFDLAADTISGVGTPNAQIQVCANIPNRCITRWVTAAEGSGDWMANYGVPGTDYDDPDTFDVQPGSNGWAADYEIDSDRTWFDWWIPNPRFSVFPEQEYIEGWEWPDGATIYASIEEKSDCSAEGIAAYNEWDPITFVQMWFPEGCDAVVGDVVTMTDNETTRQHTIQNLVVTGVDAATDTVSGAADPGVSIHVWPHGYNELLPTADTDGNWMADFTETGPDLVEGMSGRTEIRDEFGNATAVDWYVPNTRFTVWPGQNYLEGYEWPDGALVSISVAGKESCSTEAVSGFPEWDQSNTFFSLSFPDGCTIGTGDLITLSYESLSLTHQVQELAIVAVDLDANTVSGTAAFDPEQYMLHTWIHGVDGSYMQLSTEGGNWLADFDSQGLDLQPGMGGRVELVDQSSSATAVEWYVPNPRIVVQITDDWFRAENFTPNGQLTFWIYDAEAGALLRHPETTWQLDGSGSVTVGMWELGEFIDLVPGHYLVVSDGTLTKELALEALTFDVFDLTQGLLQGTAPGEEGRLVWVGIGFENGGWFMDVFTDVDGNWAADFGNPVPSDYWWVAAQIFDADGDASELRPEQILGLGG